MEGLKTNMKDKSGNANSEVCGMKTPLCSTFSIGFRCRIKVEKMDEI